jgi:predicted adenylyl cyclase CyaB
MPRNIEIKAKVGDALALRQRVKDVADQGPHHLIQDDTFFVCPHGRLKLREFADGSAELIAYQRPDQTGPKTSSYERCVIENPAALRRCLSASCGVLGRVRKQRTLFLVGRTRVHLDVVEGLGDFMELEVVLGENASLEVGMQEAEQLMQQLGIASSMLVEGAYLDLLSSSGKP